MTFKLLATLALALAPMGSAFVASPQGRVATRPMSAIGDQDPIFKENKDEGFDVDKILSKVPEVSFGSFDIEAIKDNLMDGNVGERGEAYAAAQFALLACIVAGGIPFVGDFMMLLLGPVLSLAGIAAIILSVSDLGNNLSPWVVPSKDGDLVQDGIYSKLRHPQYAGFLAAMAGFSIISGSASRLLLTAFLFYVLNEMVENEEAALTKKFPEYENYKKNVPGKFFPDEIIQQLPWNQE